MACFFIATFYGDGSVFRYFSSLAGELVSRGHRVIILLDGQCRDAEDRNGNPSILTWPSRRPTEWRDARFLHSLIRRYDPACIIGNFAAVNICTLVGWFDRVPVRVAWTHTLSKAIEKDGETPRWKLYLLKKRKRLVYRFATHIVAVSNALAEDQRLVYGVPAGKLSVLRILLSDPPAGHARPDCNKVLYAGRLSPTKGLDVLLRAVPLIREACPDVIVEFLGDGPMRREYEALARSLRIEDACAFLGARPISEVYERLAAAAVMAAPSIHDSFPLVTVEASSAGVPVVASNAGGIPEIVVDGETGFLVPPLDPDALAEKIILLLKNEDLRRRFGQAARARFESIFSIRNVPAHADFLESLLPE